MMRTNIVDMSVIMPNKPAAKTPISVHTCGSFIVSTPSLSSVRTQNARSVRAHARSVDNPDLDTVVQDESPYTEALNHPPVFTRQPSVAKRASM